jgi:hypothetical protein
MGFDGERNKKALQWREYGQEFAERGDPYGRFFASWISLVIMGKDYLDHFDPAKRVTGDREPLLCLFEHEPDQILNAIYADELAEQRHRLAQRQSGQILKLQRGRPQEKAMLRDLSRAWETGSFTGEHSLKLKKEGRHFESKIAEEHALLELFLQVRNGLFHGVKLYVDQANNHFESDNLLLADINPMIDAIIKALLRH